MQRACHNYKCDEHYNKMNAREQPAGARKSGPFTRKIPKRRVSRKLYDRQNVKKHFRFWKRDYGHNGVGKDENAQWHLKLANRMNAFATDEAKE
jgi:hypothetical protein